MDIHLRTPTADELDAITVPGTLRIEVVDERNAHARTAVHRAAFGSEHFTDERWQSVADAPAYRRARCLVGVDGGVPVAAITLAGAAALREMGASSARVAAPSENTAAVATYVAAGFEPWVRISDLQRV